MVTVPATLSSGETGQVIVTGAWRPDETLKISCPDKVILTCGNKTMDIGIIFNGIEQSGSYTEAFNIHEDITVEDKNILFGTWIGHLEYIVEFEENITPPQMPVMLSFKINNIIYQYEDGMTWIEWCNSKYNTDGYYVAPEVGFTTDILHAADGSVVYNEYGVEILAEFVKTGDFYTENNQILISVQTLENNSQTENIKYEYSIEDDICVFTYIGSGCLVGWEFNMTEGLHYIIEDEDDVSITIKILEYPPQKLITINVIIEE